MNNYEKAKEEGISDYEQGLAEVSDDGGLEYTLNFLSSFAEKIKEGVITDCVDIISESRTVHEFAREGNLECKVRGKAIADIAAKYESDSQTIKE